MKIKTLLLCNACILFACNSCSTIRKGLEYQAVIETTELKQEYLLKIQVQEKYVYECVIYKNAFGDNAINQESYYPYEIREKKLFKLSLTAYEVVGEFKEKDLLEYRYNRKGKTNLYTLNLI